MSKRLATLIQEFPANPQRAGRAMRELSETDPRAFLAESIDILRRLPKGPGLDCVLTLLAPDDYLVDILWDDDLLTTAQATELAAYAQRLDGQLSLHLGQRLGAASAGAGNDKIERVLEILTATPDAMVLPLLLPFTRHPNRRIRSKAILMMGLVNRNAKWAEKRLSDPDPRVRANAVESMWNVDSPEARALLSKSAGDRHHRVAANALLGLYRLGDPTGIRQLIDMSRNEAPEMRAASSWAMGECDDPRFLSRLRQLAGDPFTRVADSAAKAAARIQVHLCRQADAAPLRVRLFAERIRPAGQRELWVSVASPEGFPLHGLTPMAFAVYEDERLVTDYSVEEARQSESLAAGFAFPRSLPAAVAGCLRYKTKPHQWALAGYVSGAGQGTGTAEERADCLLSASPSVLTQELDRVASGQDCTRLYAAVRSLLKAVSQDQGNRHVIVLVCAPEDCHELASSQAGLAEQAQKLSVPIHVVAGPHISAESYALLEEFAHKCGGRALRILSEEKLADAVSTLYLSLMHSYRIAYRHTDASGGASQTMVRVASPTTSGYHMVEDESEIDHPLAVTPSEA
ncbi:MAG: HEAT repeat domain-containing protein [Bryobacteraceae bacterium]